MIHHEKSAETGETAFTTYSRGDAQAGAAAHALFHEAFATYPNAAKVTITFHEVEGYAEPQTLDLCTGAEFGTIRGFLDRNHSASIAAAAE